MVESHRAQVEELLAVAAAAHRDLLAAAPAEIVASLPVDAQGITRAIDHIASALGFSVDQRRELVRSHSVNPAVLHARVFGASPLTTDTVIGAFVDGAMVRAQALIHLAEALGDDDLARSVRLLLVEHPLPATDAEGTLDEQTEALRDAYAAQEAAVLLIAGRLDAP